MGDSVEHLFSDGCFVDEQRFCHALAPIAATDEISPLYSLTQVGQLSMSSIKRDVKKKAPSRPEWRFFLEIQPTVVSLLWRSLALLSILVSFSADGDDAVEFKRAASGLVASEATMVLSEARGLWLFLVIREGITCNG